MKVTLDLPPSDHRVRPGVRWTLAILILIVAFVAIDISYRRRVDDARVNCAVAIEAHRNLERHLSIAANRPPEGWPTMSKPEAELQIFQYEPFCY